MRIPTYEDLSMHDQHSQSEAEDDRHTDSTPDDHSVASSENSFMPGQGAVSSTPATSSRHHTFNIDDTFASQNSDDPSWSASMESPLVRLDKQLQSFNKDEESQIDASQYADEPTMQQPRVDKGKSKEPSGPLLNNVLRQNHNTTIDQTSSSIFPTPRQTASKSHISPLKVRNKPKTPIPPHISTYMAPSTQDSSPLMSPQRQKYERTRKTPTSTRKMPLLSTTPNKTFNDSFDDSVDLMEGMSPPVTMQFARAPRSSVGLGLLGKTPKGEAAARIRRDLLGHIESHGKSGGSSMGWGGYDHGSLKKGTESSMSTVPTPPSLSRYTRHAYPPGMDSESMGIESSLESMMRRVGLNVPGTGSTSRSVSHSTTGGLELPTPGDDLKTPDQQRFDLFLDENKEPPMEPAGSAQDSDSDSDSLDDAPHNPGQPSAAFLMASQGQEGADDSFGSSNRSSDSLDDVDEGQGGMVHPFAGMSSSEGDGFEDDSFDDDYVGEGGPQEETVFGVPPAQRAAAAPPRQHLHLLGEDLLQDTIGIGQQLAMAGRVEESPTPYPGPRG